MSVTPLTPLDADLLGRACQIAQRLPRWLKDTRGQTPQERDLDRARLVRCILRLASAQRDFERGFERAIQDPRPAAENPAELTGCRRGPEVTVLP